MRQPALETLAHHRGIIAVGWWFCFLGGPVWVAVLVHTARRRRATLRSHAP